MTLIWVAFRCNLIFFFRFPLLSQVHLISCMICLVCLLNCSFSCFLSDFLLTILIIVPRREIRDIIPWPPQNMHTHTHTHTHIYIYIYIYIYICIVVVTFWDQSVYVIRKRKFVPWFSFLVQRDCLLLKDCWPTRIPGLFTLLIWLRKWLFSYPISLYFCFDKALD